MADRERKRGEDLRALPPSPPPVRPVARESVVRMLLVEDSNLEARLLEDRLNESRFIDHQVTRVTRLSQALSALEKQRFDIVLLDLTLPDSSGIGTLQRIRDRAAANGAAIVVITANADETMALEAVKAGAQDYLIKGEFQSRVLIRTIQNAIERQRMLIELTEARQRERHLATHDALTELPNRYLFNDRLAQALAAARRQAQWLAVLFIDLDRFKTINDTLGHSVGDQLLQAAARRLLGCLRAGDTAARISGDEFIILLPVVSRAPDAAKVAQNVEQALARPFRLDGRELHVTTSVGVAIYPNDGADAEALIGNADTAMYSAKDAGGACCRFYSPEMNASALRLLALENHLRRAIEKDQLLLHFQPKVDGQTGRVIGAEALVRWNHPEFGLVPPGEFIPIAEERGLIGSIGAWVLRAACQQNRNWQRAGYGPIPVAVNVSSRQFWQTDFRALVEETLEETELDANYLALEITESCLMRDMEATIHALRAVKGLGVEVSIDDFGTGYSSLSVLRRLPLDSLKIDRMFVDEAPQDRGAGMVASAIIALANSLGLQTIAEGVETPEQRAFLLERDCTVMQGFLFSVPLTPEEFTRLLAEPRTLPDEKPDA